MARQTMAVPPAGEGLRGEVGKEEEDGRGVGVGGSMITRTGASHIRDYEPSVKGVGSQEVGPEASQAHLKRALGPRPSLVVTSVPSVHREPARPDGATVPVSAETGPGPAEACALGGRWELPTAMPSTELHLCELRRRGQPGWG